MIRFMRDIFSDLKMRYSNYKSTFIDYPIEKRIVESELDYNKFWLNLYKTPIEFLELRLYGDGDIIYASHLSLPPVIFQIKSRFNVIISEKNRSIPYESLY